jgi:TetR/AcrR family transcriptional regulator, transcriptional repressor for nem operon
MPRPRKFEEEDVLQRAMELFWKQGFQGTSMDELVHHLGISRASLYSTFGNKEDLFRRVLKRYQRQNLDAVRRFLADQPSALQGLRKMLEISLKESAHDPNRKGCFVVNTTAELASHQPEIVAWLLDNQESFEQIYAEQIRRAQAAGEIPSELDSKVAASYFFTMYCGLKVVGKYQQQEQALRAVLDLGMQALRQGSLATE